MKDQPFLNAPTSILLDLVRGLAALVVLIGHIVDMKMYTGFLPLPYGPFMGHHAVIVFFVLSGLVIAHSSMLRTTTLREFAIARIARIVPTAWLAILFAAGLFMLSKLLGLPEGLPPPHDDLNMATFVLPFLFLSESAIGQGAVWNPPFWSLAYEVWYYALFAALMFLDGRRRWLWLAVLAFLAGWKVLLLLPIWLMGVAIVRFPHVSCISLKAAPLALIAGLALCFAAVWYAADAMFWLAAVTGLEPDIFGFSRLVLTDTLLGIGIALVFIGLRPVATVTAPLLERLRQPAAWLAGFSFTLYVLHLPLLLIVRGHGIGAGDSVFAFLCLLLLPITISAMIARQVEQRSPQLRAALRQRFGTPRMAQA